MIDRLPCFAASAAMLLAACGAFGQAAMDEKSREVIQKADAALAAANSISLTQTREMTIVQDGKEQHLGSQVWQIQAQRPGLFRMEKDGDEAEFTVSTGKTWVRYATLANAYQKTDVSPYKPEDLFRAPEAVNLVLTGRGITSLWLGKHSLASLFDKSDKFSYVGTEEFAGSQVHRVDVLGTQTTISCLFSTDENALLLALVASRPMGTMTDEGKEKATRVFRTMLSFSDWQLDPQIPAETFAFTPPEGAKQVKDLKEALDNAQDMAEAEASRPPPGKPFPTRETARSGQQISAELLKAANEEDTRQYLAHGHRDPSWDDAAIECLALMNKRVLQDSSYIPLVELREKLYHVDSLGCEDPVITYLLANVVQFTEGAASSRPHMENAYRRFANSSYPPSSRLSMVRRYLIVLKELKSKDEERIQLLRQELVDTFAQACAESVRQSIALRCFIVTAPAAWDDMTLDERGQALDKMRALPSVDPWLLSYFTGLQEIDLAWKSRGGGWAYTVNAEGWKGFAEHLAIAREELVAAWKLHPELPHAATNMITVAMAGHAEESARTWFDRAIAAQIDWGDAYSKLRWAYQPRWGGSADWIFALGLEAAQTARFDSNTPQQYWLSLLKVRKLDATWQKVMSRPGALDALKTVCDGYVKTREGKTTRACWLTIRLLGCWAAEDEAGMAETLERLDGHLSYSLCMEAWVDPDQLSREASLLTGPEKDKVRQGLHLLRDGSKTEAATILRQAMVALRDTKPQDCAYLGDLICAIPFTEAPESADLILDTMIEMHRHEALVQSFIRWMADSPEDVPEQLQDRVSAYVGPICWAFMQEAPTKNSIPEADLTAGISRISAMTRADIPGIDQVREDRIEAEFQTQKTLALLRLHYCWDPGKEKSWSNAWDYNKDTVAPLVKACAWRGPLTDFLTEHHLRDRHVYNYDHTILFKMAAHVWKIDDWEVYQAYRYLPDVERLADITDAESRREEAWRLYEKWGTPRIGLQIARVLSQAGDAQEAALFERHVIAYVNGLSSPPYRSFDGIFAQALEFNTVPGYEDRVIGYAGKLPRPFHYLANIRLAEADALERQGDLEEALVALAKDGIVRAPDNQWLYVGEGRYHGSGEALDAILRSIAEHPNATPKTFALMESMFPQRVADALDGAQ